MEHDTSTLTPIEQLPRRRSRPTPEQISRMSEAHRLLSQAEAQRDKPESQPSVASPLGRTTLLREYIAGGYTDM